MSTFFEHYHHFPEQEQAFLKQYLLSWYRYVKAYRENTDPGRKPSTFDLWDIREELYRKSSEKEVITALRGNARSELSRYLRDLDREMLALLQQHYSQHEFEALPQAPAEDRELLLEERGEKALTFTLGPLLLHCTLWSGKTEYVLALAEKKERMIYRFNPIANGRLPRFRTPVKRHQEMLAFVKQLGELTDWRGVDTFSQKQMRTLEKEVRARCKEQEEKFHEKITNASA